MPANHTSLPVGDTQRKY